MWKQEKVNGQTDSESLVTVGKSFEPLMNLFLKTSKDPSFAAP